MEYFQIGEVKETDSKTWHSAQRVAMKPIRTAIIKSETCLM